MNTLFASGFTDEIAKLLGRGGIGVLRTDTLYGVVASASDEQAVNRVYAVKARTPSKSPIVLVASLEDMFDEYDQFTYQRLRGLWPGKNSIILPSTKAPYWIRRDNGSVAYRIPENDALRQFLSRTGPLIAPSANPEGKVPAMTIEEAKQYFGDRVDFYVDGDRVTDDSPSKLYRLTADGMERLR